MKFACTILGLFVLVTLTACSSDSPGPYDFIASFSTGRITPDVTHLETLDGRAVFVMKGVTVGDEKRDAIVTLADAKVEFDIPEVPPSGRLVFAVGMGVDRGDGAEGVITVQADGQSTVVYKKSLNPIDRPEDRHWFDESVDLSKFDGKPIKIVFSTSPGPKGDAIADWFSWSSPRLE